MKKKKYSHYVKIVAAVHVVVIALFILGSGLSSCITKKKPDLEIPVDLMFVAPSDSSGDDPPDVPEDKTDPKPPDPPKDPNDSWRDGPPVIEKGKKIDRPNQPPKTISNIDPEKVKELLEMGYKPGDHNAIVDDDTRCKELVRIALYKPWIPPAYEEVADDVVIAEIGLGPGGVIVSRRLQKRSGNPDMDNSVLEALKSVTTIKKLSPDFIKRYRTLLINFVVPE